MKVGPLSFAKVEAGTTHVGDDRGGWIHASQRPRHEVRLPAFYVLETPLSATEVSTLIGDQTMDKKGVHEGVDASLLQHICAAVRPLVDEDLEVRPPSLAEWTLAHEIGVLKAEKGYWRSSRMRPSQTTGAPPWTGGQGKGRGMAPSWINWHASRFTLRNPVPLQLLLCPWTDAYRAPWCGSC